MSDTRPRAPVPAMRLEAGGMPTVVELLEDGTLWIHYQDYFDDGTSGGTWTVEQLRALLAYARSNR